VSTQFLVRLEIAVPDSLDPQELDDLVARERAVAAELAATGNLLRLWREPSGWANWGLWAAEDRAGLLSILGTLPLWPYMTAAIFPVTPHPSDPAGVRSAG
jgi:muconolactone D-isomerase